MSKGRRRLLALGLGLGLVVVAAAGCNWFALRQGFGAGLLMDNVSVPAAVGWRWLPDQTVPSPHGYMLNINGYGLRDAREVAVPKPPGVFRVLCLGDSFTFGIETSEELTYVRLLEQRLAARAGGRTVEVLNAGVNGMNSCQELAWLERYGWALEPDVVTVGFVMNDVLPLTTESMPRSFPGRSWMLRWPLYHWMRYHVVNKWRLTGDDPEARRLRTEILKHQGKIETAPSSSDLARRSWEQAGDCLAAVARDARERNVPAVLIVFPSLPQMKRPRPLPEPQAVLTELADREEYLLVDLLPRYASAGEPALLESDKAHPSKLGHAIAAEELAAALIGAGYVPGP
ncbi:MAG: SGNH/GDSL hydrolase family protein [Planctomycetota bacterium]|jgi:lysophospholipase L1-like esterase